MIWLAGGSLLKLSFKFEFLLRELRMSFWFIDLITVKLIFDSQWTTSGFYRKYLSEINTTQPVVNPIQDGLFQGNSQMVGVGGGEGGGLVLFGFTSQKSHTYPTMMALGTVIPYLMKIQKIYKSRDISLFTGNQQILPHQERQI